MNPTLRNSLRRINLSIPRMKAVLPFFYGALIWIPEKGPTKATCFTPVPPALELAPGWPRNCR